MRLVPFALLLAMLSFLSCDRKLEQPPNVVFILADDLGWADLPFYGNQFNEAPNLMALANQGRVFTNAYAACPVCSPSRASIQTGQYPARLGIIDFLPGHWRPYEKMIAAQNRTQYLPLKMETLGELMQRAGYRTGYFGKWHLGNQEQNFANHQGYDESVIFQGSPYYNYNKVLRPNQNFPEEKVLSEALTDLGVDFIQKNSKNPFFLFLAHYDVHVQLDADSAKIEKYLKKPKVPGYPSNAIYAAMIEQIDESVGRIMQTLKDMEVDDHTILIFFSDNGGLVSRFDKVPLIAKSKQHIYEDDSLLYIASSNAPLRAEKGTLYEGGIREPMIVKWPGKIPAGSRSDAMISSVDFFPTLMQLTGGNTEQIIDGKNLLPVLQGDATDTERALFWHYPVYHHSRPASAIRHGDWKLIYFYDTGESELYNLKDDVGESNNLVNTNPEKSKELKAQLDRWLEETHADLPKQNPDFDEARRGEWGTHPGRDQMMAGEKIQ
ncbi:MAG: sulfatase [Saprospiraceae bacterium]|nr:sulfatase [Saprospiraceae bacterium]